MSLIFESERFRINKQGEGWKIFTLVDSSTLGNSAIVARRWSLEADAQTQRMTHGDNEEMLYVISGSGEAIVGDQRFHLEPESLLWLEGGDSFQLIAGDSGLEILQGYAPGE